MDRRQFICALVLVPVGLAIAACGDPDAAPVGTAGTTVAPASSVTVPSTAPVTVPSTIPHPTGADDVVLKIASEGGLVPAGHWFTSVPTLLVSGDGRAFTPGPIPAVYPGPLLPNIIVRTIGEDGIQALLGDADQFGLLASPPDYSGGDNVADAPDTVVTLDARGGQFVHSAYALGIVEPETGARKNLQDAVRVLTAGWPGTGESYVPATYRLRATATDSSELTPATDQPIQPTIVDWPDGTGVELAEASDCARVEASAVGTLFVDAKQNTYFRQHDVVYSLAVRGVLPGDPAC